MTPTYAPSGVKLTEEQVRDMHKFARVAGDGRTAQLCHDWRTLRAACDEKDAELARLMEESLKWMTSASDELTEVKKALIRATAAEAETTRLRAVVEKLQAGLLEIEADKNEAYSEREKQPDGSMRWQFWSGSATALCVSWAKIARLLAETAPDVPADHDGSAG